jgi:4-hydroxy-tetrahydrodipicolinate synthase
MADQQIKGIFTPHLVPLDEQGQINEAELRRFLDWLIEQGSGLYPNGSTSEFVRFTEEERKRIVKVACEQADGKAPVLAGAAEANTKETIKTCEFYKDCGARAAAVVSPFYYRLNQESIYAYFKEIALNSPLDITLYNIPQFASPIELDTICRLAELERIVGIKDSSGDVPFMMRMIAAIRPHRPAFAFLSGWEAGLVPMLLAGCKGGTHATANVAPELLREVYDSCQNGDYDAAQRLQYRLLEVFDVMITSGDFPDGFRMGAELRGFDMGASRQPLSDSQKAERPDLKNKIRRILLSLGLIEGR